MRAINKKLYLETDIAILNIKLYLLGYLMLQLAFKDILIKF